MTTAARAWRMVAMNYREGFWRISRTDALLGGLILGFLFGYGIMGAILFTAIG